MSGLQGWRQGPDKPPAAADKPGGAARQKSSVMKFLKNPILQSVLTIVVTMVVVALARPYLTKVPLLNKL